jgi:hypothetical protein
MNSWRYQRQISPGIQEYIEAISLRRYLQSEGLISYEEAAALIPGGVQLTKGDYIMGIFDLVGELMRFGITAMTTSGSLPGGQISDPTDDNDLNMGIQRKTAKPSILTDLRSLKTYFEALDAVSSLSNGEYFVKDFLRKIEVMKKCVEKVEFAVYGIMIRGQERPKGWVPDISDTGPEHNADAE